MAGTPSNVTYQAGIPEVLNTIKEARIPDRFTQGFILAACSIAVLTGQPSQPPTFKVAIDVVSIDAVVTNRKGDVVPDLTASDFEVLQDGKRQKVTSAQFVAVGSTGRRPLGA